jgi:hypothetical protein
MKAMSAGIVFIAFGFSIRNSGASNYFGTTTIVAVEVGVEPTRGS